MSWIILFLFFFYQKKKRFSSNGCLKLEPSTEIESYFAHWCFSLGTNCMINHRPEIKKVFFLKEFLFKMLFTTLGANNTNRKLRYTQFWISWNYFKAKSKISFFFDKKKRFFFIGRLRFKKNLLEHFSVFIVL